MKTIIVLIIVLNLLNTISCKKNCTLQTDTNKCLMEYTYSPGNQIERSQDCYNNIENPQVCQEKCQQNDECDFFAHNHEEKVCRLKTKQAIREMSFFFVPLFFCFAFLSMFVGVSELRISSRNVEFEFFGHRFMVRVGGAWVCGICLGPYIEANLVDLMR